MPRLILIAAATLLVACGNPDGAPSRTAAQPTDPATVLDAFYETAAAADFDAWIALFTADAMFYGTDPAEAWPRAAFAEGVQESFETGTGWDFDVRERTVTLSPDGTVAWFAELSHFNNTDYLLRPTGVIVSTPNGWKIAQLVMGVPFPNAIYDPLLSGLQATEAGADPETDAVNDVLTRLHTAAAEADGETYFDLFTDDGIFIGTDATERWDIPAFKAFAKPYFEAGRGWTYTATSREIALSPMKNIAWFDELLDNDNYGVARGSGVLVRQRGGDWKISQYHLTFPIPNDVTDQVIPIIKAHGQ